MHNISPRCGQRDLESVTTSEGHPNPAALPACPPESAEQTLTLTEELSESLRSLAAFHKLPLGSVFEAGWGVMMQRYNRAQDILFYKMDRPGSVRPARLKCRPEQSITGLLHSFRSQDPVFSDPQPPVILPVLFSAGPDIPAHLSARYPLALRVREADSIQLWLSYHVAALYSDEEAALILEKFTSLLRSMALFPDRSIMAASCFAPGEREKVLVRFHPAKKLSPAGDTAVSLFEKRVAEHPKKPALLMDGRWLSYGQLNCRANQLARKLRNSYVRADDIVAVSLMSGFNMIIAIMGVLKAGGAYLPVDPDLPQEDKIFLLEDSQAKAFLHEGDYGCASSAGCPDLDLSDPDTFDEDMANLPLASRPGDLACCLYPVHSGKNSAGVLLEHRCIAVMSGSVLDIRSEDRLLQASGMMETAAVWELFAALLSGVPLCLIPKSVPREGKPFHQYLKRHGVTAAILPKADFTSPPPGLRVIFSCGETPCIDSGAEQADPAPRPLYRNLFGFPETMITALYWKGNLCRSRNEYRVPSGKPGRGYIAHILDGDHLCGIGIPGELCVGGNIARGYLNRPELTAARFVANPFGEGLLFRTGRPARWLPDGNIELLDPTGQPDTSVFRFPSQKFCGEAAGRVAEMFAQYHRTVLQSPVTRTIPLPPAPNNASDKDLWLRIGVDQPWDYAHFREVWRRLLTDYPLLNSIIYCNGKYGFLRQLKPADTEIPFISLSDIPCDLTGQDAALTCFEIGSGNSLAHCVLCIPAENSGFVVLLGISRLLSDRIDESQLREHLTRLYTEDSVAPVG